MPGNLMSGIVMPVQETGAASTTDSKTIDPAITWISAGSSVVGLSLVAVSFMAPGFRPGDVVGANIGGGMLLLLGWLLILVGIAAGAWRVGVGPRRLTASVTLVVLPLAGGWLLGALERQQLNNYVDPLAYEVNIVNDGPRPVGVAVCAGGDLDQCTGSVRVLAPGDVTVATDGYESYNPWRVTTVEGRLIGCLELPPPVPGTTSTAKVSSTKKSRC